MVDSFINSRVKTPEFSLDGRGRHNEPAPVVLIVDDDEDGRVMLKVLLELWKFRVVEAGNGIEAISVTEKIRPDLILMDVKLPNLNGFDVTRKIRQSSEIERVPIVFVSGCAEVDYKEQAFAAGGNEYLSKPLDFEKLETALGRYVFHPQQF